MTAKFFESHYDDYLNSSNLKNLHPKLEKEIFIKLPNDIENLCNIIIYGAKGVGKYTQLLNLLKRYSPSDLKYEKKLMISFNKNQYYYKLSDIHIEIDMSLLGCNAKLLWNDIYTQVIDIATIKNNKTFIIVCKNFQDIHSELLENFYSYMQTIHYLKIKLKFILISEHLSFIPDIIINMCKVLNIARPNKSTYIKCIGKKISQDFDINLLNNIKNLNINSNQLMNPHEITCGKILNIIYDKSNLNYNILRDLCYDIFIYHLDIYECIWYILKNIINHFKLSNEIIKDILKKTYNFFKFYNNNYRPIYHLENYILYLIDKTNG